MSGVVLSARISRVKRALVEDLAQDRGITSSDWLREVVDSALLKEIPHLHEIEPGIHPVKPPTVSGQ